MDGLSDLIAAHGFTAEEVAAVHVRAPVTHLNNLMYQVPADALQAKFSLEYGLACILLTGTATLADFTEQAARRPDFAVLYPRLHRHPVDKAEGEFPTEVEVVLKDGRRFETKVPWPAGSLVRPFTEEELWAKFDGCTVGLLPAAALAAIRDALADLPQLPRITALTAPLAGSFAS
jgi:2-methylcitrate dehydratase PrpD